MRVREPAGPFFFSFSVMNRSRNNNDIDPGMKRLGSGSRPGVWGLCRNDDGTEYPDCGGCKLC